MKSFYTLSTADDIILDNFVRDKEFLEFSRNIDELSMLTDSNILLYEAVKDSTTKVLSMGGARKHTAQTTKDIIGVYGNITDANADFIKSGWDLFVRVLNLFTKSSSFIIEKITKIPKAIIKVADRTMDIPAEVKSKIRGDITLYITANDIGNIYNKLFVKRLIEYITLASDLSKGEFFSTFFNRRRERDGIKSLVFGKNDMKLCRKMDDIFKHLENMEFKPSIIKMNDDDIVNIYFGNNKSINFTDIHGDKHECSYFDALNILIKDLESKRETIETVHKSIGDKVKTTELNHNYNDLSKASQNRLHKTLNQISKVTTIIGNFIKYIANDLNTINNSINKIINKQSSIHNIDAKKATKTPETKVPTKL